MANTELENNIDLALQKANTSVNYADTILGDMALDENEGVNINLAIAKSAKFSVDGSKFVIDTTIPDPEPEPDLPYVELEYIQGTGTQYVDTGIYPTTINKIDVASMFTAEIDNPLFGCRASASGDKLVIGINYTNEPTKNKIQYGYGKMAWTAISTSYIPVNTYFTLSYEFVIDGSSGKISWNNSYENVYDSSGSGLSELSNVSIYLFGRHQPYTEPSYICGQNRIYNCKMYGYSGSLVRDLIPVKRTSDNEICMFDKVTNQFFTNQGTGSFIAGPEI